MPSVLRDFVLALIAKQQDGKRYTIVQDYLGTPIQALDSKGEVVWDCILDIYGDVLELRGKRDFIPFRFQGQCEDQETGLYYNRFRYYSPETGNYISQDPIGLAGGLNVYAYVHDSNSWIDFSGLSGLPKVFWSGGKRAQDAARDYAEKIGGEILEMTPQGKALEKWTTGLDWETQSKPLWEKLLSISQDLFQKVKNMLLHSSIRRSIVEQKVFGKKSKNLFLKRKVLLQK